MAESEAEASADALTAGRLSGAAPSHNIMDRFIDGIELIAAFFVGIVAADIFASVLLRYFFQHVDLLMLTTSAVCCLAS